MLKKYFVTKKEHKSWLEGVADELSAIRCDFGGLLETDVTDIYSRLSVLESKLRKEVYDKYK